MASIIGQKEQHAALKEINSARREIENSNKFLEHQNVAGKYTIVYTADDGTRCSAVAHAVGKEEIDRFVLHHKQLVADRVSKLAKDNRILLDVEEKSIFGLDLTSEEQEQLYALELAKLEAAEKSFSNPAGQYQD